MYVYRPVSSQLDMFVQIGLCTHVREVFQY